jgi:hypothetical protein
MQERSVVKMEGFGNIRGKNEIIIAAIETKMTTIESIIAVIETKMATIETMIAIMVSIIQ